MTHSLLQQQQQQQQQQLCYYAVDPTPPGPAPPLLDWATVHAKMQWGVIMLLGGGFAIADAVKVSRSRF